MVRYDPSLPDSEVNVNIDSQNDHHQIPLTNETSRFPDSLLAAAFSRFKQDIVTSAFVPWKFYPRGADFEPASDSRRQYIEYITIQERPSISTNSGSGIDESYSLELSSNGSMTLTIASPAGGIYGLNTLTQLFYKHSCPGGGIYTPSAPISIQDTPVFSHRGLNLDISRNSISPRQVMHTIDSMSFTKLNHLHLHATDSQSWPIEIPALPALAAKGAYKPSLTWTVADLADVQTYAAARGIQSYLEIDTPGHTASIAHAYPELIAAFNEPDWPTYAAAPPSGQLKLNSSAVTSFVETLYGDLLPRIAPFSNYFHTGGDEINANVYLLEPGIGSNAPAAIRPHLQAFLDHSHRVIRAQGLTPIVWEETLLAWNMSLPKATTVVQTWIGAASLATVVKAGYRALFGDHAHWYLDCGYGSWLDPAPANPRTSIVPPYADYCSPSKNWRHIYAYDPLANITAAEERARVIGGEVHIWGELTDGVGLDGKVWPRAAAAAEVLWSGVQGPRGVDESVTRRLAELRERLVAREVGASMVQMEWCLQNLGGCQE
ncbi:N-acetyl-glucosamine-6-phosphate deacetylase [Ptychographa xylographoides]|nr:N-acetyl-glucosamine-6-phosphate deacetylase [Ptychographa xylographoides]